MDFYNIQQIMPIKKVQTVDKGAKLNRESEDVNVTSMITWLRGIIVYKNLSTNKVGFVVRNVNAANLEEYSVKCFYANCEYDENDRDRITSDIIKKIKEYNVTVLIIKVEHMVYVSKVKEKYKKLKIVEIPDMKELIMRYHKQKVKPKVDTFNKAQQATETIEEVLKNADI